jgi:hypothetical protein
MWATLIVLIPRVGIAALPPADLAMMALLVLASFEAVLPLPLAMQMLGESLAAARRIFTLVDAAPAVVDPAAPLGAFGNSLSLRHVFMRYSDDAPWALQDVSFDLHPRAALQMCYCAFGTISEAAFVSAARSCAAARARPYVRASRWFRKTPISSMRRFATIF